MKKFKQIFERLKENIKKKNENISFIKKEKFTNNKVYLTFEKRLAVKIITVILSFTLFAFLIISSIKINITSNLRYKQSSNLDYRVNLKPNDFYHQKTLGKDMQYIASLIDSINVDFIYNFSTSDTLNYKYTYSINSEVQVLSSDGGNVIFSRKEKLKNDKTISKTDSDNFNIKENVVIDYDKYNNMIKSFKSQYGISADSNLVVTLAVKVMDEEGNELKKLSANNSMNIIIPLTEQMISIKMDYKEINNSDTFETYTDYKINNKVLFGTGVLFALGFLVSLFDLFRFLGKLTKKKTAYDKALAKILREFDRIIVESKKNIIIDESQVVIDVKSFNELLDARDNLEKPILFKEIHKRQKSEFIVKNSYEVYRYVLKAIDLEKEKK